MRFGPKAVLGVAAVAGALAYGTAAHAYLSTLSINKCLSGKVKTLGKGAAAYTGCYSKGASKNIAVDPVCLGKASTKTVSAFGKLDAKPPCLTTGDGAARDADTATFGSNVNALVGDGDAGANKCDSAKQKLVGKYVAGITGCYAKAAGKTGTVDNAIGGCTDKVSVKFQNGVNKAELKPPCTTSGLAALASLQAAANAYIQAQACALDPSNPDCVGSPTPTPTSTPGPLCGNGVNDPGEACDASAPSAGWATCGSAFTCTACNCACPSKVTFSGDPNAPESILDTGWTGISHRAPIISNGQTTITLSGCSTGPNRPCGTCTVSGPVENPNANAGELATRRCTNDTSIQCTSDAPCTGGGGTCQYYFGAPLPLAAGGVTTCVVNQFNGAVSGTANVETGYAVTVANLTARVYNGIAIDNPCPRCVGDGAFNDGTAGGTCDGGARVGLACDSNGDVPARPDFGRTSLDCPPNPAGIIATLPIDLSNKTDVVAKTLTGASPNCTNSAGNKCLCDTCNNAAATPCDDNADCTLVGATVCGGKRCLSGPNNGTPCSNNTECPSGSCARPGEPTKPAACQDDTSVVNRDLECSDGDADGEGECDVGPLDQNCSVASGHAQRGCLGDGDCGGGGGSCEVALRGCFLTGGGTFQPSGTMDGSDTLEAVGMADTPMQDTSNPTLAAVFCVGPTGAAAVNNVAGLPGPSRVTIKGQAVGKP